MKRNEAQAPAGIRLLLALAESPRLVAALIGLWWLGRSGSEATAPLLDGVHTAVDFAWTMALVVLIGRESPAAWLWVAAALGALAAIFAGIALFELAGGERTEIAELGVARAAALVTWIGGATSLFLVGVLTLFRRLRELVRIELPHLAIDFALTSGVLAVMWVAPRAAWVDPVATLLLAGALIWLAWLAWREATPTARRLGHEGRA